MSSTLKIIVDYPCELEIDQVTRYPLSTGIINKIELRKGTYSLVFLFDGVKPIEETDFSIEDDNCEILLRKAFVKYPLFNFVERSCNYPFAIEYNHKWAIWNGKYATTPAIFDEIDECRCYLSEPYLVKIKGKEGLVSEHGDILLNCDYDRLEKCRIEPGNMELFDKFLSYMHSGRKSNELIYWEKQRNVSLNRNVLVKDFLALMPIFYAAIVSNNSKQGVVGFNNEIFVPTEFDRCDFLTQFSGNWMDQRCMDNEILTRANSDPVFFKVQNGSLWNIFEAGKDTIYSEWMSEIELMNILSPKSEEFPY